MCFHSWQERYRWLFRGHSSSDVFQTWMFRTSLGSTSSYQFWQLWSRFKVTVVSESNTTFFPVHCSLNMIWLLRTWKKNIKHSMLCVSGVYLRGITNTFVFNFAHACESAEVCSSCWSYSWRLQSVFQDWSRDVVRSRRFSLSQLHPSTDVYILCQNRHRKSAKCSDHIRSWNFGTHSLLVSGFQRCVLASHFVSSVSEGTFLYILFSSGAPYPPTLPPSLCPPSNSPFCKQRNV